MRVLLVSQMYPGPSAPDLGIFVKQVVDQLERAGNEVSRVVIDHRGGSPAKYGGLAARALAEARRFHPDVVYAHFLFPAGAAAAFAARRVGARLVLTAHGRDVRNVGAIPGVATATAASIRRADAVIAVSDFLRRELEAKIPDAKGKVHVIDSGVDLTRFSHRDPAPLRAELGWERPGTHYLCVGTLDERKNVVRLADAFATLDEGSLVFAGDGPLRGRLEGRERVRLLGRVAHEKVADLIAASDVVCQPSLIEPFGQAVLEALASERPVVATRIGGPAELVTPETGVLVDPGSVESIAAGLSAAGALPRPNPAARAIAVEHDVVRQAARVARLLAGEAPE
ncbi:MAG TPA: glycosyltransferase family 4 protein [Gaiellaceae bacterium]|jgi:glycosyltransferase involved in cell wall biosynthesis|nr:glycosyltransferase family 4 protein [Gaiellaceae bacterium]